MRILVLMAFIAVLALATACKGSASAKVNASGEASGEVEGDDDERKSRAGEGIWEDDNPDPDKLDQEQAVSAGRSVEGQRPGGEPILTLPGFRMFRNGTSRVFVEVSANVPVREFKTERLLTYRFEGARVPEKVNRMDLPTMHFPTPVARVRLKQLDNAAEMSIELKSPVKQKTRLRQTPGGTVLSVDFPKPAGDENAQAGKAP